MRRVVVGHILKNYLGNKMTHYYSMWVILVLGSFPSVEHNLVNCVVCYVLAK
ncbi:MAG: hypothetical protein RL097_514 [Candidatus Parcubacteria bacterium]|jgi:hypothetical protein